MRCVSCGGDNPDHARHCLQCGTKLPPAPTRAERRPVTVLFCDLIGSTELSEKLDPEDFRELIQEFQSSCADAVGRHEGHIAQFLGDGLLVYFGYPVAHDDDATRAVAAGLDIVRSLGARRGGQPMQVRVGVHSGLVVVGQVGVPGNRTQLAIGETPNVASRVQGEAAPDSVVITDATARLVEGFFELEELNPRALRGLSRPVKLFRVVRRTSARNRLEASRAGGLTPFVGRTYELGLLQQNWDAFRDLVAHIALPACLLGYFSLAYISRMTRSFMLNELAQEYVVAARAKGLSETRIIWRHALRNAMVPLVTVIALSYGGLLEGSVLTETVFAWPGLGLYLTNSLQNADMNAVLGATIVVGSIFIGLNLLADLLYQTLDPRTRAIKRAR